MIDKNSLDIFGKIALKYSHFVREDYRGSLIGCTFVSGAKLEINNKSFKLITKDNVAHEFEYSDRLCVALEVQDEDVFITVYNCIDDNIYENVFNVMIYERYP